MSRLAAWARKDLTGLGKAQSAPEAEYQRDAVRQSDDANQPQQE
jgi:hypothetical protein